MADDREKRKDTNRVNQLENLVENYTRTERHLEQHSDIGNPDNLAHAKDIQDVRAKEIENLENAIVYGEAANKGDEVDNIKKNYEYTKNYLEENAEEMDPLTLERTKEKQHHRQVQLDCLKDCKKR